MPKTIEELDDDMREMFDEMSHGQFEAGERFILTENFWDAARRKVDDICDNGGTLYLEEDRLMDARVFTCVGDADSVQEMRNFVGALRVLH